MAKINKIKDGFKLLTGRAMYYRGSSTPLDYMEYCFKQIRKHYNISALYIGAGTLLCFMGAQEAFKSGLYQGAANITGTENIDRIKHSVPEEKKEE